MISLIPSLTALSPNTVTLGYWLLCMNLGVDTPLFIAASEGLVLFQLYHCLDQPVRVPQGSCLHLSHRHSAHLTCLPQGCCKETVSAGHTKKYSRGLLSLEMDPIPNSILSPCGSWVAHLSSCWLFIPPHGCLWLPSPFVLLGKRGLMAALPTAADAPATHPVPSPEEGVGHIPRPWLPAVFLGALRVNGCKTQQRMAEDFLKLSLRT